MKRLATFSETVLAKGQTIIIFDKRFLDIWYITIDEIWNEDNRLPEFYSVTISFFDIKTQEMVFEGNAEITKDQLEETIKSYGEVIAIL